jgi:hypothetical protein
MEIQFKLFDTNLRKEINKFNILVVKTMRILQFEWVKENK